MPKTSSTASTVAQSNGATKPAGETPPAPLGPQSNSSEIAVDTAPGESIENQKSKPKKDLSPTTVKEMEDALHLM